MSFRVAAYGSVTLVVGENEQYVRLGIFPEQRTAEM
jgi:hypothetical protein